MQLFHASVADNMTIFLALKPSANQYERLCNHLSFYC
jgi:hypothetical protein